MKEVFLSFLILSLICQVLKKYPLKRIAFQMPPYKYEIAEQFGPKSSRHMCV